MKKNIVFLLAISSLIFFGCSKEPMAENGPQNGNINGNDQSTSGLKIEVVSGGGQKDVIGNELANPVVVKVTQNGSPLSGYIVEFQGSGCNQDFPQNTTTGTDGTASYVWHLAGDVGQQTLKAYILNSQNQKADSVSIAATGIAGGSGWHNGGCAVSYGLDPMLAKLSTGKLFGYFNDIKPYLRYSTDNGVNWNVVKSLGNKHYINWIFVTATDELYVSAMGEGLFYSNDAGQTWKKLPEPPFSNAKITGAIYTSKGSLIVATQFEIDFSSDKGQTWNRMHPANYGSFATPVEDKNGNLYVVEQTSGTIYKSKDEGATWAEVPKGSYERVYRLYIDKNGWFFKSGSDGLGFAGLSVSKDGGATYTKLVNGQFLERFSIQGDGNYYYETGVNGPFDGMGLYQYNTKTGETKLIRAGVSAVASFPYVFAQNGNLVVIGDLSQAIYLQK